MMSYSSGKKEDLKRSKILEHKSKLEREMRDLKDMWYIDQD